MQNIVACEADAALLVGHSIFRASVRAALESSDQKKDGNEKRVSNPSASSSVRPDDLLVTKNELLQELEKNRQFLASLNKKEQIPNETVKETKPTIQEPSPPPANQQQQQQQQQVVATTAKSLPTTNIITSSSSSSSKKVSFGPIQMLRENESPPLSNQSLIAHMQEIYIITKDRDNARKERDLALDQLRLIRQHQYNNNNNNNNNNDSISISNNNNGTEIARQLELLQKEKRQAERDRQLAVDLCDQLRRDIAVVLMEKTSIESERRAAISDRNKALTAAETAINERNILMDEKGALESKLSNTLKELEAAKLALASFISSASKWSRIRREGLEDGVGLQSGAFSTLMERFGQELVARQVAEHNAKNGEDERHAKAHSSYVSTILDQYYKEAQKLFDVNRQREETMNELSRVGADVDHSKAATNRELELEIENLRLSEQLRTSDTACAYADEFATQCLQHLESMQEERDAALIQVQLLKKNSFLSSSSRGLTVENVRRAAAALDIEAQGRSNNNSNTSQQDNRFQEPKKMVQVMCTDDVSDNNNTNPYFYNRAASSSSSSRGTYLPERFSQGPQTTRSVSLRGVAGERKQDSSHHRYPVQNYRQELNGSVRNSPGAIGFFSESTIDAVRPTPTRGGGVGNLSSLNDTAIHFVSPSPPRVTSTIGGGGGGGGAAAAAKNYPAIATTTTGTNSDLSHFSPPRSNLSLDEKGPFSSAAALLLDNQPQREASSLRGSTSSLGSKDISDLPPGILVRDACNASSVPRIIKVYDDSNATWGTHKLTSFTGGNIVGVVEAALSSVSVRVKFPCTYPPGCFEVLVTSTANSDWWMRGNLMYGLRSDGRVFNGFRRDDEPTCPAWNRIGAEAGVIFKGETAYFHVNRQIVHSFALFSKFPRVLLRCQDQGVLEMTVPVRWEEIEEMILPPAPLAAPAPTSFSPPQQRVLFEKIEATNRDAAVVEKEEIPSAIATASSPEIEISNDVKAANASIMLGGSYLQSEDEKPSEEVQKATGILVSANPEFRGTASFVAKGEKSSEEVKKTTGISVSANPEFRSVSSNALFVAELRSSSSSSSSAKVAVPSRALVSSTFTVMDAPSHSINEENRETNNNNGEESTTEVLHLQKITEFNEDHPSSAFSATQQQEKEGEEEEGEEIGEEIDMTTDLALRRAITQMQRKSIKTIFKEIDSAGTKSELFVLREGHEDDEEDVEEESQQGMM